MTALKVMGVGVVVIGFSAMGVLYVIAAERVRRILSRPHPFSQMDLRLLIARGYLQAVFNFMVAALFISGLEIEGAVRWFLLSVLGSTLLSSTALGLVPRVRRLRRDPRLRELGVRVIP